ncbi:MAG: hypothetical protein Q9201_004627 [Fulgogasparrea decipioides]
MNRHDFTVGWICALTTELVAACELLDEEYPPLPLTSSHDTNTYKLGRMGDHYVVIACLPKGRYGIASAATVAKDMLRSFESIRIGLMVGIGGGAPSKKHDIRLGDIVVNYPARRTGGVLPYKFGKAVQGQEFEVTGGLNSPPTVLLTALNTLEMNHERKGNRIANTVRTMVKKNPRLREKYQYPGAEKDRWYESTYTHVNRNTGCDVDCGSTIPPVIERQQRSSGPDNPVVHYGIIASADQLMKDAIARDRISQQHDVLCFEMEAAGLSNDFPCVVIRGICDYSDSHKNDEWQGYAAATAASYAKELLQIIPGSQVAESRRAVEVVSDGGDGFHVQFQLMGLPVAGHFVNRDAEIETIEEDLLPAKARDGRKIHILHGLGGIGKTQLAIAYTRKYQHRYSAIVWVNGNNRDTVLQSLAAFARRAGVSSILESTAGTAQQAPGMKAEADAVLKWLAIRKNGRWLMIFDNVDRDVRSDEEDTQAYSVASFLPAADHGSVLITTRLPSLGELGESTEVGRLGLNQALELLSYRSGWPRSSSDMNKLVQRLGYLPLALVQAGKYMRETKTSCSKYLDLYETSWSQLLAETPRLRDYENGSIQTTWMISYDRIRDSDPTAAKLLQLWAYLDRQDIWYELFSRGSAGYQECEWLQNLAQSEIKFKGVIGSLLAYSLIESNQHTESYSIHPVVHDWCAETISDDKGDLVATAMIIISMAVPDYSEPEYWLLQQRLLPHAERCIRQMDDFSLLDQLGCVKASDVFHNLANLYYYQDKPAEAEKLYRRALDGYEKVRGPDYHSIYQTLYCLGLCYIYQCEYTEAEKIFRRALDGYDEKIRGPDHPSIYQTLNYLGLCYIYRGEYTEAEKILRRVLEGYEKLWVPDHHSIYGTLSCLGLYYTHRGEYTEAEKIFWRALDGYEKICGPDHPSTYETLSDLGVCYTYRGEYTEAEKILRRALEGYEKLWSPDHPSIYQTLHRLGLCYTHRGEYTEAEKILRRALDGFEKVRGPDHPSIYHSP